MFSATVLIDNVLFQPIPICCLKLVYLVMVFIKPEMSMTTISVLSTGFHANDTCHVDLFVESNLQKR